MAKETEISKYGESRTHRFWQEGSLRAGKRKLLLKINLKTKTMSELALQLIKENRRQYEATIPAQTLPPLSTIIFRVMCFVHELCFSARMWCPCQLKYTLPRAARNTIMIAI